MSPKFGPFMTLPAPDACRWMHRFCKGCVTTSSNAPKVAPCPVCREPAPRGFEDFKWAQMKQEQLQVKCPQRVCFLPVNHMKEYMALDEEEDKRFRVEADNWAVKPKMEQLQKQKAEMKRTLPLSHAPRWSREYRDRERRV